MPLESLPRGTETTGMRHFSSVFELLRECAGEGLAALLLSGSHATGEAVWVTARNTALSLSDLDLYLVLQDDAVRDRTRVRVAGAWSGLEERASGEGLAAPLEVAILSLGDLERLPARPGSIALRRHAVAVLGGAAARERVPAWGAADVPLEERLLLLENRAFELLLAHPEVAPRDELSRLRARHAVHKTALDLAAALALERGELPDGARARVEWARSQASSFLSSPAAAGLDAVWQEALAWREGGAGRAALAERSAWDAVAHAWCPVWLDATGAAGRLPIDAALRAAKRAPLRRRLRAALRPESRSACAPSLGERFGRAWTGTPQHRVNAAAAVLLFAATRPEEPSPTLDAGSRAALLRLGVAADAPDWRTAALRAARAWDCWVLDGRRVQAQ